MTYDYAVFVGKFQPVHAGHVAVIKHALKLSEKLIIVIGSADKAPDIRNPFTVEDRVKLIKLSVSEAEAARIEFIPQVDYTYNDDRWIASIQTAVSTITLRDFKAGPNKIAIVGYEKDHTSYYLKKFPQWEFIAAEQHKELNSTDFRKLLFEERYFDDYVVNVRVLDWLTRWQETAEFKRLQKEYVYVRDYKDSWAAAPYAPTFVTVDALVRQSGHLLLVTRRHQPGSGLWALPGGFVNQTETLEEAAIRELYEETRLDIPKPVLKGSLVKRMTFDDPNRSARGRTISECFDFKLNDSFDLPKVKGSDDAEKAFWLPFSEVVKNRNKFFEDHYEIVAFMTGL